MGDIAVSLCDKTGLMMQPWAEAGIECYCVDVQHSIRADRTEGNIHFVWGDVRSWTPPAGKRPIFISAFPPCTDTSVSGTRDHHKKRGMLLRDALEMWEACRQAIAWSGAPGFIEQPISVLASIPHIGKPHFYFHPADYAGWCAQDNYTKKTSVWGFNGFTMPAKRMATELGEPEPRIWKMPPSDERADLRSATPLGFSRAVFDANCPDRYRRQAA